MTLWDATWYLATLSDDEAGDYELLREAPVGDDLVEQFMRAAAAIRDYVESPRYGQLTQSYERFIERWTALQDTYLEDGFDQDPREAAAEVAALYIQVLASIHVFLDHTRAYLAHKCEHATLESWDSQVRSVYDSQFAYRFMYRLRNYALHVGAPVTLMTTDEVMSRHIYLAASRDELLMWHGWGGMKIEVEHLPEQIDAGAQLEDMMACLHHLFEYSRHMRNSHICAGLAFLEDMLTPLAGRKGSPVLARMDQEVDLKLNLHWFPVEEMRVARETLAHQVPDNAGPDVNYAVNAESERAIVPEARSSN